MSFLNENPAIKTEELAEVKPEFILPSSPEPEPNSDPDEEEGTIKSFHCPVNNCGQIFYSHFSLVQHTKSHLCKSDKSNKPITTKKEWTCTLCHKIWTKRLYFRKHESKRDPNAPIKCYQGDCQEIFCTMTDMRTHFRQFHGKNAFPCTYPGCTKSFAVNINLKKHKEIHGRTSFKCFREDCDEAFKTASLLQRHVRIVHRREINYECRDCSKSFRYKLGLQLHLHHSKSIEKNTVESCIENKTDANIEIENEVEAEIEPAEVIVNGIKKENIVDEGSQFDIRDPLDIYNDLVDLNDPSDPAELKYVPPIDLKVLHTAESIQTHSQSADQKPGLDFLHFQPEPEPTELNVKPKLTVLDTENVNIEFQVEDIKIKIDPDLFL